VPFVPKLTRVYVANDFVAVQNVGYFLIEGLFVLESRADASFDSSLKCRYAVIP